MILNRNTILFFCVEKNKNYFKITLYKNILNNSMVNTLHTNKLHTIFCRKIQRT